MITLKSAREIEMMAESGALLADVRYLSETISRVMAELLRKLALKGMNMRLVSV